MNEEVRALVNEGLFYDNLLKLVDLCDARFDTNPSVYGSLSHIFQKNIRRVRWAGNSDRAL